MQSPSPQSLGPQTRAWPSWSGAGPPRPVTRRCPLRAADGSPTDSTANPSRRFSAGEGRITETLPILTSRKGVVTRLLHPVCVVRLEWSLAGVRPIFGHMKQVQATILVGKDGRVISFVHECARTIRILDYRVGEAADVRILFLMQARCCLESRSSPSKVCLLQSVCVSVFLSLYLSVCRTVCLSLSRLLPSYLSRFLSD